MEYEVMLAMGIFCLTLIFLLAVIWLNHRKHQSEIDRLSKKMEEHRIHLMDTMNMQEGHHEQWHSQLLNDNHQMLKGTKEALQEDFIELFDTLNAEKMQTQANLEDLQKDLQVQNKELSQNYHALADKHERLLSEYQEFQEYIEEQVRLLANQTQPLPEQLDALTSKLAQIKALRHEISDLHQPISLGSFRTYRENSMVKCNQPD